jgi:N-acetylmuramoyl-L-alanine amidase
MRAHLGSLLALAALLLLGAASPLEAETVRIEVRSASGILLGDLLGVVDGKATYFALTDVARLVRGTVRTAADGTGVTLARRGRALEMRRDSARVLAQGRVLALSEPVRMRERTWMIPGELVVKGVPALLGGGVQVRAVPATPPLAAASPPPPAGPAAGPPPETRPTAAPPRVVLASLPPEIPAPPVAGAPGSPARPAPSAPPVAGREPLAAPAPTPAPPPASVPATPGAAPAPRAPLGLRHGSHAGYTRIVVDGIGPGEPEVVASDQGVTIVLGGLGGPGARVTHPVRDGLIDAVEIGEVRGRPAVRVSYEQVPAARRVFRLESPARLVVDFYRAAGPRPAPAAGLPESAAPPAPAGPETARPPAGEPAPPAPVAPAESERAPVPALKVGALEVRHRSYPAYTRVVLEGASPFEPRLVESAGALVVPLAGLAGRVGPATRTVADGLVAALELGESRGQPALRITFERRPAARKVHRLQDPPRLVLDFYKAGPAAPAQGGALQTIVIDPGHGGQDPGAIGPGGLQEKEVTLDIARRVALLAAEELGIKAVLTRPRDQFLSLRERTAFANRQKGDLFVSIHVNAAPGATATGTETYFLSSEATDNAARAAAAFENKVIALEPGPRGGARDLVRTILWDLTQSEFQQESSHLAEAIEDSLDRALRQPSRGVKQAPFYVLGGAAMPAVLVEIGFLTNPQEEQRLRDDGYRDRIARAIVAGLAQYKRHYDQKSGVVVSR